MTGLLVVTGLLVGGAFVVLMATDRAERGLRRPPAGGPGSFARGVATVMLAGLLAAWGLSTVVGPDECVPVGRTVCDAP